LHNGNTNGAGWTDGENAGSSSSGGGGGNGSSSRSRHHIMASRHHEDGHHRHHHGELLAKLPECLLEIVANCSMQRGEPEPGAEPKLDVDHAYVVHYTGNERRRAYQLKQLPKLGVSYTLVTGYDREELSGHNRACVMTNSPRLDLDIGDNRTLDMHKGNPSYVSQVIKLFAALYDALHSGYGAILMMEDDVVIHYDTLPSLAGHVRSLRGNYSIIYSGSYNPKGTDGLPAGLYPKDLKHIPGYRGAGRMMPAVGSVLSAAGAAHILTTGTPIRAPVDMTMSDWRLPSAPKHGAYVSKPFAFTPGAYGTVGIFGGESITTLAAKDKNTAKQQAEAQKAAAARTIRYSTQGR
jgi:hypothetical protein